MTYDVIGRRPGFWVLVALNVPAEKLGHILNRNLPSVNPLTQELIYDGEDRFEKLEIYPHPINHNLSKFLLNEVEIFDKDGNASILAMGGRRAKN